MKLVFIIISFLCIQIEGIAQVQKKITIPKVLLNEMNQMLKNDQKYRSYISKNRNKLTIHQKDSIWELQSKIDVYNVNRLIQIIKKHGYFDSGNSNSRIAIFAMLMHTPKELKEEVANLIKSEYNKKRIDEASYGMITWHLEGRPKPILNFK